MSDQSRDGETGSDIRRVRLDKLAKLRADGVDPYPSRYEPDSTLAEIREQHSLEPGDETDIRVRVAGRIMLLRDQGRLVFATIQDRTGSLQLFVSQGVLGKESHQRFSDLDLGDWLGVEGTVMATRKGELSIKVDEWTLLAKSLRPMPDKWHGLVDVDTRYRQRYVDLTVNPDARRALTIRAKAVTAIRAYLDGEGFTEVETPVLSSIQGGATARPFATHYNSLELDSYLRIALELHHKRLIVGGLERVYEIGRIFRNEGIDSTHNPEFTMLEAYQAYASYLDMMDLTEKLVAAAAEASLGSTLITLDGQDVDLAPPWRRVTMSDLIGEVLGVRLHPSMDTGAARLIADELGVEHEPTWGAGRITAEVYDRRVEDGVVGPLFVTEHPVEVSPLAKRSATDPSVVERFEVIVGGRELGNAYSELNDPVDQLERFRAEASAKAAGDDEAGDIDYDYVRALEFGMPPTGGLGIGIDRLIMLLAGVSSVREVIYFPTLRPEVFDPAEFDNGPH
jgi:lysyl-tRNA synthetase class 2